jgi:hypothetical protein
MIPKQWFEQELIEVQEYTKTISYDIELENGNREIKLTISNENNNAFNVHICFYEHSVELGIYQATYLDDLEIQALAINWLTLCVTLEVIQKQFKGIQFTDLYEYYLKFGENAIKVQSWDIAKNNLSDYADDGESLYLVYELCQNSHICSQFYCHINTDTILLQTYSDLYRVMGVEEFCFIIRIQENSCLVEIEKEVYDIETKYFITREKLNSQEFPTPHEAVAYLETLLAEHLKNT